ncbi:MAG: pilus assembly protein [Methylocystis sp.]|nr:pilus assembly protein [Methylocystis sp.]
MFDRVEKPFTPRNGADRRNCAHFVHNARGFAAVEFGMIAAPFVLLVVAILEYGMGNFMQSRLDAAVAQTARQIMTGYVQDQTIGGKALTAQQFREQVLCPKLPSIMKCSDVYVDATAFSASSAPNYDMFLNATKSGLVPPKLGAGNNYSIGCSGDYVVLRVAFPAPILTTTRIFPAAIPYKGEMKRLLTSTASFKNEPFKNNAAQLGC